MLFLHFLSFASSLESQSVEHLFVKEAREALLSLPYIDVVADRGVLSLTFLVVVDPLVEEGGHAISSSVESIDAILATLNLGWPSVVSIEVQLGKATHASNSLLHDVTQLEIGVGAEALSQ